MADTITLDWSISGPAASLGGLNITGSGTLTVTTGTNADLVTAITGTVTDGLTSAAVTGLAAVSTLNGNDNLLFPVGTHFVGNPISTLPYVSVSYLDSHGIAFTTSSLGTIDIFGFSSPNQTPAPNPANNNYGELSSEGFGVGTFAAAAVPGPVVGAGLPGLLAGFGAMLTWRRKRRAAA